MGFPETRLRRLRQSTSMRSLFDSPWPEPAKFIWPVFCHSGKEKTAIDAMPGQFRLGLDSLKKEAASIARQGIGGILLFGVPDSDAKTADGQNASCEDGIVPAAIRTIKETFPDMLVLTDVCLCAYTEHGHCGPLNSRGDVDNDAALKILAETAYCHAQAGADIVAPSAMMDGQVQSIRHKLDEGGFPETLIMSYSTKFASSLYDPFREAEDSAPGHGNRKGYQQSYRSRLQAIRESLEDEKEGADILMIKPSLWYLDIIQSIKAKTPASCSGLQCQRRVCHAPCSRQPWLGQPQCHGSGITLRPGTVRGRYNHFILGQILFHLFSRKPAMTNEECFNRAIKVIPGGVNSPVRSFSSVGGTPICIQKAKGAYLTTVEGKVLLDFCQSWGPLILGHSDQDVLHAVHQAVDGGLSYGCNHAGEAELAELILSMIPHANRLRLVNSGTEAVMTALRLARAATARSKNSKIRRLLPWALGFPSCGGRKRHSNRRLFIITGCAPNSS